MSRDSELSVSRQCELVGLPRSTFYAPEPKHRGFTCEEERAMARLPVHAQLAHNVPFHIVLLSKGYSRGGYLRWRGWAKCVGAVGTSILVLLDFYVGVTGPFYIGINSLKRKLSSSQGCCQTS